MSKRKKKSLTWEEARLRYRAHLRARRFAERTRHEADRILDHVESQLGHVSPGDLTLVDLREFQAGLFSGAASASEKPLSPRAVANVCSRLRGFFGFLAEEGLIEADPARRLEQPRCPRRSVGDVLSVKEITRFLQVAKERATSPTGLRDQALVEVLYATGIRRAELIGLDLCDLERDTRELIVRRGKGGKGRRIPLTPSAYAVLREYLDVARPRLVSSHPDCGSAMFLSCRGRRLDVITPGRVLRTVAQAAGIERRVTPHTVRRSFATHLLQTGASLRAIQLLLGHCALSTTAFYLKLDTQELRKELLTKHPRERFEA